MTKKKMKRVTAGRPLKFKSVKKLQEQIDAYFEWCDSRTKPFVTKEGNVVQIPYPRPYTITGLALWLDTSRECLLNYEKKEKYFDTIRRAKLRCQNFTEESLWTPKIASGVIFNLVNNWGWRNTSDVKVSGADGGALKTEVTHKWTHFPPEPKTVEEWQQQYEDMKRLKDENTIAITDGTTDTDDTE